MRRHSYSLAFLVLKVDNLNPKKYNYNRSTIVFFILRHLCVIVLHLVLLGHVIFQILITLP